MIMGGKDWQFFSDIFEKYNNRSEFFGGWSKNGEEMNKPS